MSESKTPVPPEPSDSERAEWREATENYVAWLETELAARDAELAEARDEWKREHEFSLTTEIAMHESEMELEKAHAAIRGAVESTIHEAAKWLRDCELTDDEIAQGVHWGDKAASTMAALMLQHLLRSCLPAPDCEGAVGRGDAKRIRQLESRLAEEIKWGHRNCTHDDCKSSGSDCPANTPAPGKEASRE